jgi:hypothetical protein
LARAAVVGAAAAGVPARATLTAVTAALKTDG